MHIGIHYWRAAGVAAIALTCLAITGCSSIGHKQVIGTTKTAQSGSERTSGSPKAGRPIAIFFDGTHNNEVTDTNVKRLHSLVTLQQRDDITALYVEGVGTSTDIAGMATGAGIGPRVRLAYEFLLTHRKPRDRIYVFGFSRGAYAARILTAMLYHAGLPATGSATPREVAELVFDTVKHEYAEDAEPQRRADVQKALRVAKLKKTTIDLSGDPVAVEVLGLWDTVEALGGHEWRSKILHKMRLRQHTADVGNANRRYGDTLCNVRHAFHAVSIDDDREWVFTPLLLTRDHLLRGCTKVAGTLSDVFTPERLQEVWFAGAHLDVGGGYQDSLLSGVSLNWMIGRVRNVSDNDILPSVAGVRQDPHGTSHDPEGGAFAPIYHGVSRDLVGYALSPRTMAGYERRICVHPSVFDRRLAAHPKPHENHQLLLREKGRVCLRPDSSNDFDLKGRLEEDRERPPNHCEPGQPYIVIESHCPGAN